MAGPGSLRTVFEEVHSVFFGDTAQSRHVGAGTQHVHRHDRLGTRGDLRPYVLRVEGEGLVDFGEHDVGAAVQDRRDRRDEHVAGHDHLVARPDPESDEGGDQRGGTAVDAEAVGGAEPVGRRPLEAADHVRLAGVVEGLAVGTPTVEHGEYVVPFLVTDEAVSRSRHCSSLDVARADGVGRGAVGGPRCHPAPARIAASLRESARVVSDGFAAPSRGKTAGPAAYRPGRSANS